MKRELLLTAAFLGALLSLPVKADEPCNVTLCMFGLVSGSQDSECKKPIKKFFDIVENNKYGFLPEHTADARKDMLNNECPSGYVENSFISQIISAFGRVKNL